MTPIKQSLAAALLMWSGILRRASAFSTFWVNNRHICRRPNKSPAQFLSSRGRCRLFSNSGNAPTSELTADEKTELEALIKEKGDEIRKLEESGADKAAVAPFVQELMALKEKLDPTSLDQSKKQQKQHQSKPKQEEKKKERMRQKDLW